MILRTIQCSLCDVNETEKTQDAGWPGWGVVSGLRNPETGETEAHLCPQHMEKLKDFLNKEGG